MFKLNFSDVVASSMNNRIEYLVKYSVAPPPSRDYYGLEVLQNEVILHLWKISHGPHKLPIVRRAKLVDFDQEKSLQDEIRHAFGEYILKHVQNIAEGNKNNLLTLPKFLIGKLSTYLNFTDVVKLSSLSHVAYEIFNADLIWKILYKRDKKANISWEEEEKAKIFGWKQLYKNRQIQMSIKDQRNSRIPSSTKSANNLKTISKTISTVNIAKKPSEFSHTDLVTTPFSKTKSDTRFLNTNSEKRKLFSQRKNPKNINSRRNVNEKDVKRENSATPQIKIKRETENVYKCKEQFNKQRNKSEKYINKTNIVLQEGKAKSVASKTSSVPKSTVAKSSSGSVQNLHDKTRPKTKTKFKKTTAIVFEKFNSDKTLSDNSFVIEDDKNFHLSDLIEASLKNIRSPRNIFDYDFSYIQNKNDTDTKNTAKTGNIIKNIDRSKQLKSIRNNASNYLPDEMTEAKGDRILEKLSEKSEPFSETSTELLLQKQKTLRKGNDKSLSRKYVKNRTEPKKSFDRKRNNLLSSEDEKNPQLHVSSVNDSNLNKMVDEKFPVAKGPLKANGLLRAYAWNSLENRKNIPPINSKKPIKIYEDNQE